jgi:LETM1 and EF-hand domain-containing protein 1
VNELQQVCQSRGIRTIGVSPARLRSELNQWLDLHLKHEIPGSLLILSRAFMITDKPIYEKTDALEGSAEALQATLSSLPDQVVHEAALNVAEAEGTATYKQKLEVLKEQEELIEDELQQETAIVAEKRRKEEIEAESAAEHDTLSSTKATFSADDLVRN